MTRPLLILAALLLFGGAATAQTPAPAPALKASVTVTSEVVHIGDLVENAGPVADVPIFRAPDLGTTGAVATDRIVDAIRSHQLIGIDTRGLSEVIVTRASRAISVPEISASIGQALAGQYGFGDAHNILVNFDRDVRTLQVEPNVTGELQVLALLADGKPYEAIARELNVSYKTVVNVSAQLKQKLQARTLPQLISTAVKLLAPPA